MLRTVAGTAAALTSAAAFGLSRYLPAEPPSELLRAGAALRYGDHSGCSTDGFGVAIKQRKAAVRLAECDGDALARVAFGCPAFQPEASLLRLGLGSSLASRGGEELQPELPARFEIGERYLLSTVQQVNETEILLRWFGGLTYVGKDDSGRLLLGTALAPPGHVSENGYKDRIMTTPAAPLVLLFHRFYSRVLLMSMASSLMRSSPWNAPSHSVRKS